MDMIFYMIIVVQECGIQAPLRLKAEGVLQIYHYGDIHKIKLYIKRSSYEGSYD